MDDHYRNLGHPFGLLVQAINSTSRKVNLVAKLLQMMNRIPQWSMTDTKSALTDAYISSNPRRVIFIFRVQKVLPRMHGAAMNRLCSIEIRDLALDAIAALTKMLQISKSNCTRKNFMN